MRDEHATSSARLGETALRELLALSREKDTTLPQISEAVELILLKIDVDRRQRRPHGGGGRRSWLAKVTSFAFPRVFAPQTSVAAREPAPEQMTEEELLRHTAAVGQAHNHVCFTVEITDGPKTAAGRQVEVQLQDAEAERLAFQILRLIAWRQKSASGGTTAPSVQELT
ncbi:hypothetical protein ACFYZ9_28205 [Streptomyces sp. NPDC001691]|uniref:hypothetical protein n=1 Tax=Streptomyces sp. NPDC001691 TaxID=3364600 RepID=UPI0036BAD98F